MSKISSKRIRQSKRNSIAAINITPLVDVLLVLVAILMLLLPLYIKKLPVSLPKTESTVESAPELSKSLLVSFDAASMYYIDQTNVTEEQLLKQINPSVTVKFAVSKDVKYENLAKAITKLKEKNPKEITLVVM